jgi:hypothetical protein
VDKPSANHHIWGPKEETKEAVKDVRTKAVSEAGRRQKKPEKRHIFDLPPTVFKAVEVHDESMQEPHEAMRKEILTLRPMVYVIKPHDPTTEYNDKYPAWFRARIEKKMENQQDAAWYRKRLELVIRDFTKTYEENEGLQQALTAAGIRLEPHWIYEYPTHYEKFRTMDVNTIKGDETLSEKDALQQALKSAQSLATRILEKTWEMRCVKEALDVSDSNSMQLVDSDVDGDASMHMVDSDDE